MVLEMQLERKQQQSYYVDVRSTGVVLGNVFEIVYVIQAKKCTRRRYLVK